MMKTLRKLSLLALLPVLVSCGGGGDSGCATGLGVLGGAICGSSSPNTAPVANAGFTQNVKVATLVTLDGSGSRDENNDTLTYLWELTAKPTGSMAALTSNTSAQPQFTADLAGTYTITLVVDDGKAKSPVSSATVVASITNSAPVAKAGVNQNVSIGKVVTLDGTTSTDANSDTLSYKWTLLGKPSGSAAVLSSTSSPNPTFTADVIGIFTIGLVVNDGQIDSTMVPVTVVASSSNSAPVANAGLAQSVVVAALVNLDGTGSTDANNDPITYKWSWGSKPTGSSAALSADNISKPSFTADKAGTYVLTLIVNDGKINSDVSAVTVTASVANAAPVANAGTNQNVTVPVTVTLDGSASSDANRDALTYLWTLVSKPTSSTAALSSTTSPKPTFSADLAGVYVASLVVNDGALSSPVTTTTITASVANSAPVANAGVSQNVTIASVVTLTGAGSTDANYDTLTYIWSFASMPTGSTAALSSTSALSPTFTADLAGTYVVNLIVNDGKVNSSNVSAVTVTASAVNSAPVANAGANQTVTRSGAPAVVTVTLNGTASTDANGDTLTYLWALTTKPTSSTASLSSTTAASPTFVADIAGIYVASLIVNDGKVSSSVATVAITAN
jgi:hypothetical protein